jgi:hypothetical protein
VLGVIHRERHGLFLIDVLPGLDGVDEMLAVQVLRRGDDNGVDRLVVQQTAVIQICGRGRHQPLGVVEPLGVNIGESNEVDVRAVQRPVNQLSAAVAHTDDAHADTVVGPQHALR